MSGANSNPDELDSKLKRILEIMDRYSDESQSLRELQIFSEIRQVIYDSPEDDPEIIPISDFEQSKIPRPRLSHALREFVRPITRW